jgi:hypothetical protein
MLVVGPVNPRLPVAFVNHRDKPFYIRARLGAGVLRLSLRRAYGGARLA